MLTGMTFEKEVGGIMTTFKLPISWEAVLNKMKSDKCPNQYCNPDQANRVSWRLMKDTLLYILTMVELNMIKVEELFLGFMIDNRTGSTLLEVFEKRNFKGLLTEGNKEGE